MPEVTQAPGTWDYMLLVGDDRRKVGRSNHRARAARIPAINLEGLPRRDRADILDVQISVAPAHLELAVHIHSIARGSPALGRVNSITDEQKPTGVLRLESTDGRELSCQGKAEYLKSLQFGRCVG